MSGGVKYDEGKLQWDLVPLRELEEVIRVLMCGADKYPEPDNWKRVPEAEKRYYNAAMRHLTAWKRGEKSDPETGLNHLAHATCCLLFLVWFDNKKENIK